MVEYPRDRWSECVGCKYNSCKKKTRLSEKDYQAFTCGADVNVFPCPQIPELYSYKLAEFSNKEDETIFENKVAENPDLPIYEAYFVELHNEIDYNIQCFVALSDNIEHLRKEIRRKLRKNRGYKHLKLFNIKKLSDIFKNYNVVALPKNVTHVVYPKVDIEMDHGLSKIRFSKMVVDLERFPNFEGDKEKPYNLEMNVGLSDYDELEKRKLPKEKCSGKSKNIIKY